MSKKLRVLILEDLPTDAELMLREVRRAGYEPEWKRVETEPDYLAELEHGWDLILADYNLPQFTGLRALELSNERGLDIPFIVVSACIGEDDAVAAMRGGASDYVLKDKLARLGPAIERELRDAAERRERRAAKAALQQSEERYRSLIEAAPDAIITIGADRRVRVYNAAAARIFGFTAQEMLGRVLDVLIPPEYADRHRRGVRRYLDTGQPVILGQVVELKGQRKDGSVFPLELAVSESGAGARHSFAFTAIIRDISERKRGEQALRLARFALDQSAEMILWIDREGQVVYANDTALRLLGYSREELLGAGLWQVAIGLTAKAWSATWDAGREAGSLVFEDRSRRKDGSTFPVEVAVTQLAVGDTELRCSVARDITRRKQAEEALRDSEASLRRIVDNIHDALYVDGPDGKITFANDQFLALFGVERAQLPHLDLEDYVAPEWRAVLRDRHERRLRGEAVPTQFEYEGLRQDGRRLWLETTVVQLLDDTGRVIGTQAADRDITQRKLAEAAILAEKAFSEAMLDSLPGIFYLFDHTGRFLRWNHAFETVSGYSAAEIAAMRPRDFFTGEDRALIEQRIGTVFATGAADAEAALVSKDGRRTSHYFVGLRFAVDGVPCCIGTGIDLTARKQLEAQLRQAQKIEAVGQLAGGVAHDFNNLLGVIIGYGEMAQLQLGPDHPARARVDQMLTAAGRAASLTRQLLAFSRKQVLQPKLLDLNGIVADTQKLLGRLMTEDVELVIHPAAGLGRVKADPGQIEQVILNLAVNARDAMPKGGRLTLETANVDLGEDYCAAHPPVQLGRYVMLAISDTGTGMDQETQQRIFEPFFTTKPEGEGTGLGLATVYGIVKQSGGYIWVYSEPGHGTTFKVFLPRVDELPEDLTAAGPPAEATRGHETILLVEDTATLQEVIRETLEDRGYTVLLASNGEEALAAARERSGPIHLLLTDVVMPKLGGGDLARLLSALRPEIRVLFMSGYTDGAISQRGVLRAGVVLLEKPFTGDKLARAVREALDQPAPRG